ncbi:hypothetical protein ACFV9E_35990 [Streptomyces sp. NPDC059835]|uniref:hypothetical protein n=1 Tax=Streptomyces sp. NPDC059835 TaxID=3346967 RepID=UPI0036627BA4
MLDFAETVRFDPHDLQLVIQTVRDDPSEPPPAVQAVLDAAEHLPAPALTAEQLWRLSHFADPASVYNLSLSDDTALHDERLASHIRLWSATREQAPRTTAALELVTRTETELGILAARINRT